VTIDNIIKKIDSLLREAKFDTFFFEKNTKRNHFCYDLLVKKKTSVFLVKVFPNIDNLNESMIENIKLLSMLLNSKPLLIGVKNRYQLLEDNTLYVREGLPFITVKTLENVLNEHYPYIFARRGGSVIFLDGALMRTRREEKNISRKELSEKLGVTKRTLCSYENESMRPSQQVAEKILEILEDSSIFRKIDLLEWHLKVNFEEEDLFGYRELTEFESHLQDIFEDIGVSTIWYKKGQVPFEFTINSKNFLSKDRKDTFYPLFSGLSQEKSKISKINLAQLQSFAQIFQKNSLFIVANDFKIPAIFNKIEIPVIRLKKLEELDSEQDFIKFYQDS
jgi:predicted transcriptional regulator